MTHQPGSYKGTLKAFRPKRHRLGHDMIVCDLLVGDETVTIFLHFSERARRFTTPRAYHLGFNGNLDRPEFDAIDVPDAVMLTASIMGDGRGLSWDIPLDAPAWIKRKPSGAPPPPPAAFPSFPAKAAATKATAWAYWCEQYDNRPSTALWQVAIKAIGKPEAQFTDADWEIVTAGALPF